MSPPDVVIKKLKLSHAGSMSELEKACFSMPWSFKQCAGALAQKSFAAFGLWRGNALLAYISFYHAGNELEILNLAVLPAERRQGFARRILLLALQVGHKMGMQKVLLEVRESNVAARALYEDCGFQKCGRRPHYYTDCGEDALIYGREL